MDKEMRKEAEPYMGENGQKNRFKAVFFPYIRYIEEYIFEADGISNARSKALSLFHDPDRKPDIYLDEAPDAEMVGVRFAWVEFASEEEDKPQALFEEIEEEYMMYNEPIKNPHFEAVVSMSFSEYEEYLEWKRSKARSCQA